MAIHIHGDYATWWFGSFLWVTWNNFNFNTSFLFCEEYLWELNVAEDMILQSCKTDLHASAFQGEQFKRITTYVDEYTFRVWNAAGT